MRGRKSPVFKPVTDAFHLSERVVAPDWFTPEEAQVLHDTVSQCHPSQFHSGDIPLLHAYCTLALHVRRLATEIGADMLDEDGKSNPLLKAHAAAVKELGNTATKLRITPASRRQKHQERDVDPVADQAAEDKSSELFG